MGAKLDDSSLALGAAILATQAREVKPVPATPANDEPVSPNDIDVQPAVAKSVFTLSDFPATLGFSDEDIQKARALELSHQVRALVS